MVYKILNDIDMVNKDKLFTMSHNIGTRGHQFKIYKNRYRLNVRGNYFSKRVIDSWNELPENTSEHSYGTHSQQLQKQTKYNVGMGIPVSLTLGVTFPARGQDNGLHIQIHQQRL